MKIVIDIDEDMYKRVVTDDAYVLDDVDSILIENAIAEGIVLPEILGKVVDLGHIDEDRIEQDNPIIYINTYDSSIEAVSLDYLNNLPTVLEASKKY